MPHCLFFNDDKDDGGNYAWVPSLDSCSSTALSSGSSVSLNSESGVRGCRH